MMDIGDPIFLTFFEKVSRIRYLYRMSGKGGMFVIKRFANYSKPKRKALCDWTSKFPRT